jgi:hypothetical protein
MASEQSTKVDGINRFHNRVRTGLRVVGYSTAIGLGVVAGWNYAEGCHLRQDEYVATRAVLAGLNQSLDIAKNSREGLRAKIEIKDNHMIASSITTLDGTISGIESEVKKIEESDYYKRLKEYDEKNVLPKINNGVYLLIAGVGTLALFAGLEYANERARINRSLPFYSFI